jgi:glycosyltransferase involved in cell wall biosynthesis
MVTAALSKPEKVHAKVEHLTETSLASAKVLHVINGEHYAGAERVQDLLAKRLPEEGFEVGIACLKPRHFPTMMQTQDVTLYDLSMANRFDLRPVRRLIRIVRKEGYSILHAHTPRTVLLAAIVSLITGVPLVYHAHSPTSRDTTNGFRNRINSIVERIALAWSAAVIPVSHSLGRYVRERGVSPASVSVVPNGVPTRNSRPVRPANQRHWTIGTMALFRPRKGTEVLLKAIAKLKEQGLPVRLLAVGGFETPEYEQQVKQLVKQLGIFDLVHWTGFTQDIDTELHKMDIFVLPSLFGEGLPMVVLEAMAAGVPVVATNVEGIAETVRQGIDGLVVEPNDPENLSDALHQFVGGEADWHKMQISARERQGEKFSDSAMAAGVARVYRRVLGSKRYRIQANAALTRLWL